MSRPPTPVQSFGMFLVGLVVGDLLARLMTKLDNRRPAVIVPDGIDWDEEAQLWRAYHNERPDPR